MNRPRRAPKKPIGPSITIAESAQMIQNIRADPSKRITRDQGTEAVRDFFTRGELPIEYKQISLVCPNSNKRIVDPVRGVNCTHLECFDLGTYLELQVNKPFWLCPRCQQRVEADDLRIDEYTSYVLQLELDNVRFIEVFGDGSYRRIDPPNDVDPTAAVIIDDETVEAFLEENNVASEEQMVLVPLKSLHDLDRQAKDLRRQLPERKGSKKSKTVDPADVAEALHDIIRSIIKQATNQNLTRADTADRATQTSSDALIDRSRIAKENALQRTSLPEADPERRKREMETGDMQGHRTAVGVEQRQEVGTEIHADIATGRQRFPVLLGTKESPAFDCCVELVENDCGDAFVGNKDATDHDDPSAKILRLALDQAPLDRRGENSVMNAFDASRELIAGQNLNDETNQSSAVDLIQGDADRARLSAAEGLQRRADATASDHSGPRSFNDPLSAKHLMPKKAAHAWTNCRCGITKDEWNRGLHDGLNCDVMKQLLVNYRSLGYKPPKSAKQTARKASGSDPNMRFEVGTSRGTCGTTKAPPPP